MLKRFSTWQIFGTMWPQSVHTNALLWCSADEGPSISSECTELDRRLLIEQCLVSLDYTSCTLAYVLYSVCNYNTLVGKMMEFSAQWIMSNDIYRYVTLNLREVHYVNRVKCHMYTSLMIINTLELVLGKMYSSSWRWQIWRDNWKSSSGCKQSLNQNPRDDPQGQSNGQLYWSFSCDMQDDTVFGDGPPTQNMTLGRGEGV